MLNNEFKDGMWVGGAMIMITMLILSHIVESGCQTKNDVADCVWVSIPEEAK
jgi:hypothetical protein